jgi:ABC-type Mn2+/Zn2+ transport system permease subunit
MEGIFLCFWIWHLEDRASWCILTIKANEMHNFSTLFGKELYIFRTDLLSIIGSLITVFTIIGICHTSYVDCMLADSQHN